MTPLAKKRLLLIIENRQQRQRAEFALIDHNKLTDAVVSHMTYSRQHLEPQSFGVEINGPSPDIPDCYKSSATLSKL